MKPLSGVLPALVTPFDRNFAFAEGVCERLIAHLYEAGVHGLYVLGNTGEGMQQGVEQRKRVAECARRCSPEDRSVIIHVGSAILADSIALSEHAAKIGATAVSSLPPPGIGNFPEVRNWYRGLAEASGLPLIVYYFPEISPAISSQAQLEELLAIPGVVGLKFTDFDLFRLNNLRRQGAVVFNGRDEVFAAGMLMGANGGIGTFYNVLPREFVQIYECARSGRWDEAMRYQEVVCRVIEAAVRYPVFSVAKTWLRKTGFDCGDCLPPRRQMTDADARSFFAQMEEVLGAAI